MRESHLRVYYGPDEDSSVADLPELVSNDRTVRVALGDILPVLLDAVRSQRAWIADFRDEEVAISADLYDILMVYQQCRRPGA